MNNEQRLLHTVLVTMKSLSTVPKFNKANRVGWSKDKIVN